MSGSLVQIRRARTDDLRALADFARLTFSHAFGEDIGEAALQTHLLSNMSDERFAQMMQRDVFYLAGEGAHLTGFVQLGPVAAAYTPWVAHFDASACEIRRLYVRQSCQGQGLGSALIETALVDPLCGNARIVYLTTWESNSGAQKLYKKHNFAKVGEMPEYGSDGELNGYEHILARLL